jgi:hypothetical protein
LKIARLLAKIRTTQEKLDARMGTNQAEILARMVAKILVDAHHESVIAEMDAWIKRTEAYVGKLETNPEKSEALVDNWEVAKK